MSNINIHSRAIKLGTNFSFAARRTTSRDELLGKMVHTLADCLDPRTETARAGKPANRATYYRYRDGELAAQIANDPQLVAQSHVKGLMPEGPLATVIENEGFVFVPDILSKKHYYLLDKERGPKSADL